jgi:hypothetical protein
MAEKSNKTGKITRPEAAQSSTSNISWGILIVGLAVVILLFALQETTWAVVAFGVVLVIAAIEMLTNQGEPSPANDRQAVAEKPKQGKINPPRTGETARSAARAIQEEETVEELLNSLDEGFDIVNNIGAAHGTDEHLVVSRENGVFLIKTCDQVGKIDVSGGTLKINDKTLENDPIMQILEDTAWIRQKIREATGIVAWVKPVIVFTHAHIEEGMPIRGVTLIQKGHLLMLLYRTNTPINRLSMLWENRDKLFAALRNE